MTGVNPENLPYGGEAIAQEVTLISRAPQFDTPRDAMWPMRLHDEGVLATATECLPQMIQALSEPTQPATQDQVRGIFAKNPGQRRLPWVFKPGQDGSYSFSTGAYEGRQNADGSTPLFDGITHTFDNNGRLIKTEHIEGERSYNSGRPRYQQFFSYDDQGYLVSRTIWELYSSTITDRFDYEISEDGHKTPSKMTRTLDSQTDHGRIGSEPMTVDLAHYQDWLTNNPNSYLAVSKEELEPQELRIADFTVTETRKGILFGQPEHLEHALVMYGSGNYPTPGGKTALEYNEEAMTESRGALGGALFSAFARSGDMTEFVQSRIMESVQSKWKAVQKSRKSDATERVYFSFDYDGAGHFHKTNGEVNITKSGLELTLSAAYVGDQVEDDLANALGQKRGLRSAVIDILANQTDHEGYFLVDLKAISDLLGIPVTADKVENYLIEYLGENDKDPKSRLAMMYDIPINLWHDSATGVTVTLETERRDYDTWADLDKFFSHDTTSIWGPLPKAIRRSTSQDSRPKLRVAVEPAGNPYDETTTKRTDEIIRSYMAKLVQASS